MNFKVKKVRLDEIVDLRWRVLRQPKGKSLETAYTKEDFYVSTYHFGVFTEDGNLVCCGSFLLGDLNEENGGYQLRFMATDATYQGKGAGSALLKFAKEILDKEFGKLKYFWCNAREESIEFYEKNGWATVGEKFEIPGVGPHIKMKKELA